MRSKVTCSLGAFLENMQLFRKGLVSIGAKEIKKYMAILFFGVVGSRGAIL
jgi:hypothetical protein